MVLPADSSRLATARAAATAAPALKPPKMPTSAARRRDMSMASSLDTGRISSMIDRSITSGLKPGPMPWILCGECASPLSTCDSLGSTTTLRMAGFCAFRYCVTPVIVPPVPAPARKTSTLPCVCAHTSGPVVSRCTLALYSVSNWRVRYERSVCSWMRLPAAMEPLTPSLAGVRTRRAPKMRIRARRSSDIVSGMQMTTL
mmetsp:Transcript_7160/g.22422  ORF Transcript_7160/g.22422 Transcript_7160/m.22422 type:complete len:201 (+) Transcript_7160:297-899(+)